MPDVSAFPLAGAAYLVASGATRAEAEAVLQRIERRPVPITLAATLDLLDTALTDLRENATRGPS